MKASVFNTTGGLFTAIYNSRLIRTSLILALLFIGRQSIVAQVPHECSSPFSVAKSTYQVSFGDIVHVGVNNHMGELAVWTVSPSKGVNKSSGTGNNAEGLQFNEPGKYEVIFTLPGHAEHKEVSVIEVADTRLKFDVSSVKLSKLIMNGVSVNGTTLTIQVELFTANKSKIEYNAPKVSTTGVMGITAYLNETVTLKNGINTLTFQLSGTPQGAGPAQLGFFNLLGEGFFYNFLIAE